eukprot:TRINITY_DN23804_c0_g1_i4.p1 TRINITY_DN23804_c0_g1~~TRINITY_DN23804_c0_g1_i4.p1  ORF type:complete len:609 (+),score=113.03 TRINITY_DN23804_c0_g1_i4:197-2023(+)
MAMRRIQTKIAMEHAMQGEGASQSSLRELRRVGTCHVAKVDGQGGVEEFRQTLHTHMSMRTYLSGFWKLLRPRFQATVLAGLSSTFFWLSLFANRLGLPLPFHWYGALGMALFGLVNSSQLVQYLVSKKQMFKNAGVLAVVQCARPPATMVDAPLTGALCKALRVHKIARGAMLPWVRIVIFCGNEILWACLETVLWPSLLLIGSRGQGIHPVFLPRTGYTALGRAPMLLYAFFLIDQIRGDADGYISVKEFKSFAERIFMCDSEDCVEEIITMTGVTFSLAGQEKLSKATTKMRDSLSTMKASSEDSEEKHNTTNYHHLHLDQTLLNLLDFEPQDHKLNAQQFTTYYLQKTAHWPSANFLALLDLGRKIMVNMSANTSLHEEFDQYTREMFDEFLDPDKCPYVDWFYQHQGEMWPRDIPAAIAKRKQFRYGPSHVRQYYNDRVANINMQQALMGCSDATLRQRAEFSSFERHESRMTARAMMSDPDAIASLQVRDTLKYGWPDGPSFKACLHRFGQSYPSIDHERTQHLFAEFKHKVDNLDESCKLCFPAVDEDLRTLVLDPEVDNEMDEDGIPNWLYKVVIIKAQITDSSTNVFLRAGAKQKRCPH